MKTSIIYLNLNVFLIIVLHKIFLFFILYWVKPRIHKSPLLCIKITIRFSLVLIRITSMYGWDIINSLNIFNYLV